MRTSSLLILLTLFSEAGEAQILRWRSMSPDRTATPAQLGGPGPRKTLLRSHLLIQFAQSILPAQIQALAQLGIQALAYVPDNGLVVSAPDGTDFSALSLRWYGRLLPSEKLSPGVQAALLAQPWVVIEFHRDVPAADARSIALASGLTLREHPALLSNHLLASGSASQLQALAEWDEVEYIFPASDRLIHGETVYPCPGAETTVGSVPQAVPTIGDGWDGPGLGSAALSYAFKSTSVKLPADSAQSEIARAFSEWNKIVQVSFSPSTNPNGPKTIAVLFATYAHGDGYPFDGPGGILAHTFYPAPTNPEPIAGDMHFDDSENWHIGGDVDLFSVALHETGHALGLGHSNDSADVMYPYYKQVTGLAAGDTQAILTLYAAQPGQIAPPGTTPAAPVLGPSIAILSPASSSTYSTTSGTITISGTASDAAGVGYISWTNSTGGNGTAMGNATWSTGPIALQSGANLLTVTVHGLDAKTQTAQLQVNCQAAPISSTPDTTAPTLNITSPTSTTIATTVPSIVFSGTASDNVAVASVSWRSSTAGVGAAIGTTQWSTPEISLVEGINTITITAKDAAGNSSWRAVQVTYRPATSRVVSH
jgi:Matrixin/Glucodextranase, domain B